MSLHDLKTLNLTGNVNIDIDKLLEAYSFLPDNWGDRPPFKGDYINYGYWENIDLTNNLLTHDRIRSSMELYKELLSRLNIKQTDCVLEIGCGRGMGIVDVISKLAAQVIGIDINPDQIKRAEKNINTINNIHGAPITNVSLKCGTADNTTLNNNSVDIVCSVEAAQHFPSMTDFATEVKRILKPNGRLGFVSYFPTNKLHFPDLKPLLPLIDQKLENMTSVHDVCECFRKAGFSNVFYEGIGEHVFRGYEKWISQVEGVAQFSHGYHDAYSLGYIDYYIFMIS